MEEARVVAAGPAGNGTEPAEAPALIDPAVEPPSMPPAASPPGIDAVPESMEPPESDDVPVIDIIVTPEPEAGRAGNGTRTALSFSTSSRSPRG